MPKKKPDQLPTFKTYEEAGEFWDTHDLGDYWHLTKPVHFDIKLERKPKTIQVEPTVYAKLTRMARKKRTSLTKLVNKLLADKVASL